MARQWKEEYQDGIYHVIARGNNKEYIFKENIDKGYFIKQHKEYSSIMGYTVYVYVLMDSHYHTLIDIIKNCRLIYRGDLWLKEFQSLLLFLYLHGALLWDVRKMLL
ncbi:MAG: hypothetical protein ACOZCL_05305 [Bacillota bacterium]